MGIHIQGIQDNMAKTGRPMWQRMAFWSASASAYVRMQAMNNFRAKLVCISRSKQVKMFKGATFYIANLSYFSQERGLSLVTAIFGLNHLPLTKSNMAAKLIISTQED